MSKLDGLPPLPKRGELARAVEAAVFMSVARMRANTGAVWFSSAGSTVRFVFCPSARAASGRRLAVREASARRPRTLGKSRLYGMANLGDPGGAANSPAALRREMRESPAPVSTDPESSATVLFER